MRLKTTIFLWVTLATVLPLTVLVFGATLYSEREYREKVDTDVAASLDNLVQDIDRRLRIERGMISELAQVEPVQKFVEVVKAANVGQVHEAFFPRRQALSAFLHSFHRVVPSLSVVRVLDRNGNTLAKVGFGRVADEGEHVDADNGMPYAEPPHEDNEFLSTLEQLPSNDLSVVMLPYPHEDLVYSPMLDAVQPLLSGDDVVGYLAVSMWGHYTDQILDFTPRPRGGELLIAEQNPDDPLRDGVILYDDVSDAGFARLGAGPDRIQDYEGGRVWEAAQISSTGILDSDDGDERIYFVEYYPYPGQLVSWILANRIDTSDLSAPFLGIRISIILFAGVALLASLVVARLGARKVASPVALLSSRLKEYAHGNFGSKEGITTAVDQRGPDEIRDLQESFQYMVKTQAELEMERDQARKLVMQNAKLAGVGKLAAGIAHEINNPLNNILSLAKLAEREIAEDNEAKKDVVAVREEALRASRIVQGLLNFARQVPPQYNWFDIEPWLEESLALVRQVSMKHGVELANAGLRIDSTNGMSSTTTRELSRVSMDGSVMDVGLEGDRNQLQQVLINLIVNAIQASPRQGVVEISAIRDRLGLTVHVCDQGPGLDPAHIDRIFDPFFTTKEVGEGSGLGLSISLGIAERHGGSLMLCNRAQGGAQATLWVPVRPPAMERGE